MGIRVVEDEDEEEEEEECKRKEEEINTYLACCFFGLEHHSGFRLTALILILQGASFRNQLIIFFTVLSFVRLSIFGSHPNGKQY